MVFKSQTALMVLASVFQVVLIGSCSTEEPAHPPVDLKKMANAHPSIKRVRAQVTLAGTGTPRDLSEVTLKASQPIALSVQFQTNVPRDGRAPVAFEVYHKSKRGGTVAGTGVGHPEKLNDNQYHVTATVKMTKYFDPGKKYFCLIKNVNGTFLDIPVKIVK